MRTRTEHEFVGITVSTTDYKERDKLVRSVTSDGVKTLVLKGVKSDKAKLKFAASRFCVSSFFATGDGEILQVTGANPIALNFDIAADIKKYAAASVVCEAVAKCCDESVETKEEFLLLKSALKIISDEASEPIAVALYSLVKLLSIEGVDLEEFVLSKRTKNLLRLFRDRDFMDVVAIDCSIPDVADAIRAAEKMLLSGLGIRLNSVSRAIAVYPL